MRLRVAVVGAGYMGRLHARVVAESELAQLAAIVDIDRESGQRTASDFGVAWSASVDPICDEDSIDVAIIAVPDTAHEEPACRLLAAGKGVLLEKPMAHTLQAARRIAQAASSSQSRLMVGHLLRFDPRYVGAAAAVADGVIGQPLHASARRFTLRQVGVRLAGTSSPCFYLGVHDVDAIQWVSGRHITGVFASGGADAIFATCQLEGGLAGSLQFGWTLPDNSPSGIDARLEIVGTRGSIDVDTHDHGLRILGQESFSFPDGLHWPDVNGRITGDLVDEVNHFLRAVRDDDDFRVSVADAVRSVAVNDAILRSVKSSAFEIVEPLGL